MLVALQLMIITVLPCALRLRDHSYLKRQKIALGPGRQGQAKKCNAWRWEPPVARYPFQSSWHYVAKDKEAWNDVLNGVVAWRRSARYGFSGVSSPRL